MGFLLNFNMMYLVSLVHSMAFVENQHTLDKRVQRGSHMETGVMPPKFCKTIEYIIHLYLYIQKLQRGIWPQSNLKLCIYSSTNKQIFLKSQISSYNYNFINVIPLKKTFYLNVFFKKFIVELHCFLIFYMLVKYQNYRRSITISSIKCKNFKCFKL